MTRNATFCLFLLTHLKTNPHRNHRSQRRGCKLLGIFGVVWTFNRELQVGCDFRGVLDNRPIAIGDGRVADETQIQRADHFR